MASRTQQKLVRLMGRRRNAVEIAADTVDRIHGRTALPVLGTFLRALPPDTRIAWGDGEWAPAAAFAEEIDRVSHD